MLQDTYSIVLIASLFVIAKNWKKTQISFNEEWIKKMWFVYTVEYYSAFKARDIMTFADKWMKLENIILNVVTQTQKNMHCMHLLISGYYP